MGQLAPDDVSQKAGVSILELPDDTVSLLQQANIRLEEVIQGTVQTQNLPVGLTGTATTDIQNGETGIGLFEFSGGQYAAEVEADEAVDQFDSIRIKGEENLVTPISAEREVTDVDAPINRRQVYDKSAIAGANILDKSVRPATEGSTFRVNVAIDTTTRFDLRIEPDQNGLADFSEQLNQGGSLDSNSRFEFTFDANPDAEYNFRAPSAAVNVLSLRVQETLVA